MDWILLDWSFESLLIQITLFGAMVAGLLYSCITKNYDYWRNRNIPYEEPTFPFGNVEDLFMARIDMGRFYEKFYKKFKDQKYGGIFELSKPTLILTDLDLIRQLMTKDFAHFMDRALPPKSSHDFLANNLFAMEGKEWKAMRAKLTPTFSSAKMKLLYTLVEKCAEQLREHVDPLATKNQTINVKEIMSRFTLDIIATCAFGIEINTLADSNTDFFKISKLIFKQSKTVFIKRFFMSTFPQTSNFFQMSLIDDRVKSFLLNLVETTVSYREKNGISRNDFLDLLIKIKNNQSLDDKNHLKETQHFEEDGLTLKEMAGQAFAFFAAGFETASSTTTFMLYELARNPEIQKKLQREVDEVLEDQGGHIGYQALQNMVYMEQVVNETLRIYGSAPILVRKCTEPYKIPKTCVTIDKNIKIVIPSYAIHHDPDIYPDPEIFDPNRFTEDNIRKRHHYAFLPFGEGPRMCIGMRFGKMQVKAGIAAIVANFELTLSPETVLPLEISPKTIVTTPLHPIKLQIKKRIK